MIQRPTRSTRTDTLFPYTTLFRSPHGCGTVRSPLSDGKEQIAAGACGYVPGRASESFRCSHPVAGLVESEVQGETAVHRSWKRKECRSTSGSRFKAASVRQYRFPRLSGKQIGRAHV